MLFVAAVLASRWAQGLGVQLGVGPGFGSQFEVYHCLFTSVAAEACWGRSLSFTKSSRFSVCKGLLFYPHAMLSSLSSALSGPENCSLLCFDEWFSPAPKLGPRPDVLGTPTSPKIDVCWGSLGLLQPAQGSVLGAFSGTLLSLPTSQKDLGFCVGQAI